MKETIKIIIAVAFIVGSFFVGSHLANEKCNEEFENLQQQITKQKKNLIEKKDSLVLIRKLLMDCTYNKDDTLKVQFIKSHKKIDK
jgi:hypothetical protein